ncbi:MAG: ECF transporter S component [Desulfurococcales archaeon]|nr:ECF transporter S component [Desulfurococcales archaeon]
MPASSGRGEWSRSVAYSAVFAALVFAATLVSVATPVTRGYFNLGESMVYTAAIIGGPFVGAVSGAIGSSAADIVLQYGYYAPGTFVIKGLEGFIVGWLFNRLKGIPAEKWRKWLPGIAVGLGVVLAIVSLTLYVGIYSHSLGGVTVLELWGREIKFTVPWWVWVLIAVVVSAAVYILGLRGPRLGAALIAMLVGGLEMVIGYFIYEATVIFSLGYLESSSPLAAAAEIPVNFGQALIGASIASIIVGAVWSARGERY